ncbi:MAG: hypothetical protein V4596_06760 [Bdellovibrionota bacterium]
MLTALILLLGAAFANPTDGVATEPKRVFIETNLQVGMRVHGLRYREWRSGILRTKKNDVKAIDFLAFAHAANGRYTESKDLEYNLVASVVMSKSSDDNAIDYQKTLALYEKNLKDQQDGKCEGCAIYKPIDNFNHPNHRPYLKRLRTTNLNIDFSESNKSTNIKLSLKDNQLHQKWVIGGGANRWDLASSNDELKGNIKVGYKLPENTWAAIIQRKNRSGVFNLPQVDRGFQNAFNSNLPLQGDEKYIVWGKPGTEVYQEFYFNSYSQASNLEGSFEVVVTPIDLSTVQSKSIDQIIQYLYNIEPYRTQVNFETHIRNIQHLLFLISQPSLLESVMNTLTTKQIIQLITKLSDVAYNYEPVAWMWDLKASSTILSHELALLFLKQIIPFCRDEKIILPYTQKEVQVLGLKLANFFLEKSKMRLEFEHFKHYETLLKLLSTYNGKTFAQVRANQAEALKIKKAYDVLINTVNMRFSAFKAAHDEIKFIYDKFGSLGAPGSDNALIFDLMKNINGKDTEFNAELLSFLRLFQENNNSVISTDALTEKLNHIKANQKIVVGQIDAKIKIAGFTPTDSGTSFIQSIQAMTIHNLDILTQPLNGSFENFRKSYFSPEKVNPILNQIQGCVR